MEQDFRFEKIKYERPDYDKYREYVIKAAEKLKKAESYEEFKKIIEEYTVEICHLSTMQTISNIRNSVDTTDGYYEEETKFNQTQAPTVMEADNDFKKAFLASRFTDRYVTEFGREIVTKTERSLESFRPELVPFMQKESMLCLQYQKLMAMAKIPFNGKDYNIYGIEKLFEDPDREIRRGAYHAYSKFFEDNEEEMDKIFDELITVRNGMGRALGDENFIPLGYRLQERSDYGQKEVEGFRKQVVDEIVPLCQKLYEAQAKRIGVDELMAYDENYIFPDGNAVPAGDDDYMIRQAREMYHDMSPETGEFIDFMIGHGLLDLKNKPNKANTGYMTILMDYKAPFVFSCFNQTKFDMEVLSHELGHAFAGYQAMHHQKLPDYYFESTDIAEIHSMSMEQFAYSYAEKFFGRDAEKYRFAHLQDAVTFVPFGTAVDEFQHIVYAHPELSMKERTYEWHKLEQKYMPWRKYDPEEEFMQRGGWWHHKIHIFLYPFYYINYAFTTMGAMEFKKRFSENKKGAWTDYLNLCNAGGSTNYLNLLKLAHLSVPYEEGSVRKAISYPKEILLSRINA